MRLVTVGYSLRTLNAKDDLKEYKRNEIKRRDMPKEERNKRKRNTKEEFSRCSLAALEEGKQ